MDTSLIEEIIGVAIMGYDAYNDIAYGTIFAVRKSSQQAYGQKE